MNYRAIIIEDEEPARMLIKNYLLDHENIEMLGEFADGFSGVKAIDEMKPDLIFLDIQMPKLTGFEVLELIRHKPVVIFTTAYDQFAINAFEVNAADYLLKPFNRERFSSALNKALEMVKSAEKNDSKISAVINTYDDETDVLDRVAVKSGTKVHVIATDEIVYMEAEGDYVKINTKNSFYLKEKTMKYFENHLDPKIFVRIHRGTIINVNEIARIEYYDKESHVVFLKNGIKLKASTAGYQLLKKILNL